MCATYHQCFRLSRSLLITLNWTVGHQMMNQRVNEGVVTTWQRRFPASRSISNHSRNSATKIQFSPGETHRSGHRSELSSRKKNCKRTFVCPANLIALKSIFNAARHPFAVAISSIMRAHGIPQDEETEDIYNSCANCNWQFHL
jgi:hypothetical protein